MLTGQGPNDGEIVKSQGRKIAALQQPTVGAIMTVV
jgi:hypothetical protein